MNKKHLKTLAKKVINRTVSGYFCERFYHDNLSQRLHNCPKPETGNGRLNNILQINTTLNQGGAARVSYCLSEKLRHKGIEVNTVVAEHLADTPGVIGLKNNFNPKEFILDLSSRNKGWLDFANLSTFGITELQAFHQCDLVHLHNLHGNYFNPFVLPELTALKPTVWTLHDMQAITGHCAHSFQCDRWQTGCGNCPDLNIYPAISRDETAFLWETKQRIYDLSDLVVVCPSEWLKEKVSQSILQHKDIRLIYNGVDINTYKPFPQMQARERLHLPADKKILLFSAAGGSDNPWKGGQYLRSAYETLKDRDDLLFLNIGGDSANIKLPNWQDIPYIHNQENMALYYTASDLLLYPSLADNCPLVVLEALACGLPVIAFKTGGIPELISHGEDGYLARYKDEQDFVHGLKAWLDNDELLDKAKRLAPVKISGKFSLDKMTESYVKLYKQII